MHLVDITRSTQVAAGSCETTLDQRLDTKNEVAPGTRYLPAQAWLAAARPSWPPAIDLGGPSRSSPPRSESQLAAILRQGLARSAYCRPASMPVDPWR